MRIQSLYKRYFLGCMNFLPGSTCAGHLGRLWGDWHWAVMHLDGGDGGDLSLASAPVFGVQLGFCNVVLMEDSSLFCERAAV